MTVVVWLSSQLTRIRSTYLSAGISVLAISLALVVESKYHNYMGNKPLMDCNVKH